MIQLWSNTSEGFTLHSDIDTQEIYIYDGGVYAGFIDVKYRHLTPVWSLNRSKLSGFTVHLCI